MGRGWHRMGSLLCIFSETLEPLEMHGELPKRETAPRSPALEATNESPQP